MSEPALRVVRGDPSPEELAALVVVLASRGRAADPAPRRPSRWADPALGLRAPIRRGPGAWSAR